MSFIAPCAALGGAVLLGVIAAKFSCGRLTLKFLSSRGVAVLGVAYFSFKGAADRAGILTLWRKIKRANAADKGLCGPWNFAFAPAFPQLSGSRILHAARRLLPCKKMRLILRGGLARGLKLRGQKCAKIFRHSQFEDALAWPMAHLQELRGGFALFGGKLRGIF